MSGKADLRAALPSALLIPLLLFRAGPACGAWEPDGIPVSTAVGDQTSPILVPSYGDEAIALWLDGRNGPGETGIWTSRIRPFTSFWSSSGVTPNSPIFSGHARAAVPRAIPDGSGGLFAVWGDDRYGLGNDDIFVQRIDPWGHFPPSYLWDGNPVCTAPGAQIDPAIAPDDSTGFFVAWADDRSATVSGSDIYLQHEYDYGGPLEGWPLNGRAICTRAGHQIEPLLVPDGVGGVIVVWQDFRSDSMGDLYALRVTGEGSIAPGWSSGGVSLCSVAGAQDLIAAIEDGEGGAYVAWRDARSGEEKIYLSRWDGDATIRSGWDPGGTPLSIQAFTGAPVLAGDRAGGVYVAWCDSDGKTGTGARVTRVTPMGSISPGWPIGGKPAGAPALRDAGPALLSDGAGGAIMAWNDPEGNGVDLRAQRVDSTGAIARLWPSSGVTLSAAAGNQLLPPYASGAPAGGPIASDGRGGAIVAWTDSRGVETDIYAQRVTKNGLVAPEDPPCSFECSPEIVKSIAPNPTRGPLSVKAWVPVENAAALFDIVDVRGRVVRALRREDLPAPGYLRIDLDVSDLPAGVYFVRYRVEGPYERYPLATRKFVLVH